MGLIDGRLSKRERLAQDKARWWRPSKPMDWWPVILIYGALLLWFLHTRGVI